MTSASRRTSERDDNIARNTVFFKLTALLLIQSYAECR